LKLETANSHQLSFLFDRGFRFLSPVANQHLDYLRINAQREGHALDFTIVSFSTDPIL
jgi:hypothetical protein